MKRGYKTVLLVPIMLLSVTASAFAELWQYHKMINNALENDSFSPFTS